AAFMHGDIPDPQAEATFTASRLTWSWPEGSARAGLRQLYQDLLAVRRRAPALRDFTHRSARLLPNDEHPAVLRLVRGDAERDPHGAWYVYCNLTGETQPRGAAAPAGTTWRFCSEDYRYGGARPAGESADRLWPYECVAFGP